MDKIYSRKRIKIPNVEGFQFQKPNPKKKRVIQVGIILGVALTTMFLIIRALNPMFNKMCLEKAKGMANDILNVQSTEVLKDVDYEELVNIVKDENRND